MREGGSSAEQGTAGTARLGGLKIDRGAAAIALVCLISLFVWGEPGLTLPDGAGYYVYLPSTWIDGDLLFFNEGQRLGLIRDGIPVFKSATATGHLGNHWTVGPALVWYPAFIAADIARAMVPNFRQFHRDGVVLPYNLAILAASALAGLGTLLAGYAICRRWLPLSAAAFAAVTAWFGTTLMWYSIRDAAMSHAVSALACALVVWLSIRLREGVTGAGVLAVALSIGFAALVRIQNAAFVLVPFLMLDGEQRRALLRRWPAFIGGGLLASAPELVVSTVIYGNPLGFASVGVRAIGWHPWERFWPVETLFSWYHGLFTWTPLAAIGLAGLFAVWRFDRRLAMTGWIMFVIQWLANSAADRAFWAALSFGARRFDNILIFVLIGAAALARRPLWRLLMAACAIWTMLLFCAARLVDLNAYQTLSELLVVIPRGLERGLTVLMFIPPAMRGGSALTLILALAASAAAVGVVLAVPSRLRAAAVSLYLAAMTALMAWAGANGAARIEQYRPLIERSRAFAAVAGNEIGEQNLYENEIRYLRKSGRHAEADRTAEELRAVMQRRREALRAAGMRR